MPVKRGTVVSTDKRGWAEVITDKLDACADCASARNCGSTCKNTRITTRVLNKAGAQEGDLVSIYLSSGRVLKNAALLYLLPVTCLITGAITGNALSDRLAMTASTSGVVFGLIGLASGFISLAVYSRNQSATRRLTPIITNIITPAEDPNKSAATIQNCCGTGACPG